MPIQNPKKPCSSSNRPTHPHHIIRVVALPATNHVAEAKNPQGQVAISQEDMGRNGFGNRRHSHRCSPPGSFGRWPGSLNREGHIFSNTSIHLSSDDSVTIMVTTAGYAWQPYRADQSSVFNSLQLVFVV